ncbi:MAG: hypothetical protein IJQ36_00935 [Oscillospiraceae bacterium]|nr:hypothetical protein [Oscillospiraceae bacterium]
MINRYEGNTGRVTRMPEPQDLPPPPPPGPVRPPPPPRPDGPPPGLDLGRLLPGLGTELETEDVLLLLILYLLYRESGDRELLIVMGAMFLL